MTNVTKTLLNSFITAVFGLSLLIFSAYFIDRQPVMFWFLAVLIWIIAGIINGLLFTGWKEALISGGIISGAIFLIVSIFLVLLRLLSEAIVEYFSGLDIYHLDSIFGISFLIGLLFALVGGAIFTGSAIATIYIMSGIKKSEGIQSTQNYESELFEQYETDDSTAGEYHSFEEKEEI